MSERVLVISFGVKVLVIAVITGILRSMKRADEQLVRGIAAMLERCDPEVFALQQQAILRRPNRTALLSQITCPTLLMVGEEDILFLPAMHEAMALQIRRSDLHVLPGGGHMAPAELGTAFAAILEAWVGRQSSDD